MANEIDVTAKPIKTWKGDFQIYSSRTLRNEQIDDATAIQVSAALPAETQMVSILNTSSNRNYFLIADDTATAVTATNGHPIAAGAVVDIFANPAQKIQFLRG